MSESLPSFAIDLALTELIGEVMQNHLLTTIDSGVICHRAAVAKENNIAFLYLTFNGIKTRIDHVVQVQIFTLAPPVILSREIGHIDPREMVGILKQ